MRKKKVKISFCILNYYEDWLVVRTISQVYDFVDEILIGDTSRGKDLIPRAVDGLPKCRIVPDPGFDEGSNFSWSEWRNYVQSFAKGDWVMWTDPDEIYPLNLMRNLRGWLERTTAEAIGLVRIAYETHKRMVVRNKEPKIRIWRNLNRIRWSRKIHESPEGFKDYEIWDVTYAHDINWLPSFPQRIYKLKKRERRGNILPRIKKNDLDPYRERYPNEKEEDAFRSRE